MLQVWLLKGLWTVLLNSCCGASMLSAMVLEKAPESIVTVWCLTVQHLRGWLMVLEEHQTT
jgi:hypothetical protein